MWLGILGLFLAGLCAPASAVTVSGLYAADVPVASASADDLAEGYAAGLSKVFVRISGTRDVLSMDGVKPLLADAESLLLSYQVLRNESGESHLRMTFGAVGVNRALASVNAPVWGANRPLTLAWIAVEDRGSRALVTESGGRQSTDAWQSAFKQAASDRGLPVAFPPESFGGKRELLSDIWGQFVGRVRSASADIDHDALALVRISRSGGQWRAGWVFGGKAMDAGEESLMADSPEALAHAVVNRWTELYASRYAVAAGEVGESPQVDIVVRGVSTLADYGKITKVLEGLTPVVSVGASRVKENQLTLRVAFSGELDQLREYIALDPRFVALDSEPGNMSGQPEPASGMQVVKEKRQPVPEGAGPATPVDAAGPDAGNGQGKGQDKPQNKGQTMFSYQPLAVDEQEAEEAFESLYQVLYYRWQPAPVIGADEGR
jgi:hypothetical protein